MTTLPASTHPFTADGPTSSDGTEQPPDSTPRTLARQRGLFMGPSAKQIVPQQTVATTPTTTRTSAFSRRPQCTHMTMNRIYGEHTCHVCGKVPSLGFVYSCQQDHLPLMRNNGSSVEVLPLVPDHGDFFEAQAEIASSLGMSEGVIRQMRAGEYSYEQIEILLAQRRRVKEVIHQVTRPSVPNSPPTPSAPLLDKLVVPPTSHNVIASADMAAAPAVQRIDQNSLSTSSADTTQAVGTPTKKPLKKTKCNFQACHTCRPFFQDRVPMNVDAVAEDGIPPVSEEELSNLPIRDVNVVRNIGLRENPAFGESLHLDTCMHQMDGNRDHSSQQSTPTTTSSSATGSDTAQFHDNFPCPGAGMCPLYSPLSGCAYDHGFDDGNRAYNHGFDADEVQDPTPSVSEATPYKRIRRVHGSIAETLSGASSNASSISLPEPITAPLTPVSSSYASFSYGLPNGPGLPALKARTVCGVRMDDEQRNYCRYPFRVLSKDSSSSLGSEVEVEGGVALTEEAVKTGMPDIVTDDV